MLIMLDVFEQIQDSVLGQKVSPKSDFSPERFQALVSLVLNSNISKMLFFNPSFSSMDQEKKDIGSILLIGNYASTRRIHLDYDTPSNSIDVTFFQGDKDLTSYTGGGVKINSRWITRMIDGLSDSNEDDAQYNFFVSCLKQSFVENVRDLVIKDRIRLNEFLAPTMKRFDTPTLTRSSNPSQKFN